MGPPVPRIIDAGEDAVGVYIDDVMTLNTVCERSTSCVLDCKAAEKSEVSSRKLKLSVNHDSLEGWGVFLDEHGLFRPPPRKLVALIHVTEELLSAQVILTDRLLSVVGKWLWFALLIRPLLSVFSPLFVQARSQSRWVRLSRRSKRAFRDLIAISCLIEVNPARPVGFLVATDASKTGGGVAVCSRYERADLRKFSVFAYYKGRTDLTDTSYRDGLGDLLTQYQFTSFGWHWRRSSQVDHITVLEARALWTGLRRVFLHSPSPCQSRHTVLVDNMGVVGSFRKGRSKNLIINNILTRLASLVLVTGGSLDWVWVPTVHQPADGVSRQ